MSTIDVQSDADRALGTAATLRRAFDESFAVPPAATVDVLEGLLVIRVGADPYALRLSEIAGLYVEPKIVAVPSPSTQMLGIAGLRGIMAPVYDLAALMQYPLAARARWMVLAGTAQPVGFAFEGFDAHLQVPVGSMAQEADGLDGGRGASGREAIGRCTRGTVRAAGALCPIISMDAVMKLIGDKNT